MSTTPAGSAWITNLKINGTDVTNLVRRFEWKSLVNNGYIIRGQVEDPYFQILDDVIEKSSEYLPTGRQYDNPTLVVFKLAWNNGNESKERVALVSDLHATGDAGFSGGFEFIAVDPISYYINSGKCSGKAYKGKVGTSSGVIYQVLQDYVPSDIKGYSVKFEVGDTDDESNTYWMMRLDPKTFIASLLDWSSPFTKHKTSWIVANGQEEKILKIEIKESYTPDLKYPSTVQGSEPQMILTYGGVPGVKTPDIKKWELLTDNFISALDLKLITSGMSAISGEYWDKIVDKDEKVVWVKDQNTENKVNPTFTDKEGFTKPKKDDRGFTHVAAVPEVYSAGDIGYKYSRYIDGRARQKYMEMLNMVMRIRVTIRGEPRLFDSTELGRTKVTLRWLKPDEQGGGTKPRFLDGDWMMYGWHHKLSQRGWETDVYLARLDWNAAAVPGNR